MLRTDEMPPVHPLNAYQVLCDKHNKHAQGTDRETVAQQDEVSCPGLVADPFPSPFPPLDTSSVVDLLPHSVDYWEFYAFPSGQKNLGMLGTVLCPIPLSSSQLSPRSASLLESNPSAQAPSGQQAKMDHKHAVAKETLPRLILAKRKPFFAKTTL